MSDPYPSSEVKTELSGVSGLTYEQVQHWSAHSPHSLMRQPCTALSAIDVLTAVRLCVVCCGCVD